MWGATFVNFQKLSEQFLFCASLLHPSFLSSVSCCIFSLPSNAYHEQQWYSWRQEEAQFPGISSSSSSSSSQISPTVFLIPFFCFPFSLALEKTVILVNLHCSNLALFELCVHLHHELVLMLLPLENSVGVFGFFWTWKRQLVQLILIAQNVSSLNCL